MATTRRKKGTGQITYIEGRKSPWRITFLGNYTETGIRKQRTKYFSSESAAKAFLRDLNRTEKQRKEFVQDGVMFNALIPAYLNEKKEQGLKTRSLAALKTISKLVEERTEGITAQEINDEYLKALLRRMKDKDGYSKSVLDKTKIFTIDVLKMAAAKGLIDTVPQFHLKTAEKRQYTPQKSIDPDNFLRDSEITKYEEECRRTYYPAKYTKYYGQELMVHSAGYRLLLILHTGCRLGEALALTWEDYDEYSKTLLINKNVVSTNEGKEFQSPKTQAGNRLIVLNKNAVDDLEHLKREFDTQTAAIEERRKEELKNAGIEFSGANLKSKRREINERYDAYQQEHKYICGSANFPYGCSSHNGTLQAHKKIMKKIGIDRSVNIHGLRHTYTTHYYLKHKNDADFDIATFSRSIGHSSIRTTMEIYAHLGIEENRHVQRTVEDLKDF